MTESGAKKAGNGGCLIACLLLVGAIIAIAAMPQRPQSPAEQAASALENENLDLTIAAEKAIRERLRDPDSAKFSNLVDRRSGQAVVCGAYNAKNGFGGYVGDRPYMMIKYRVVTPISMGARAFARAWKASCPTG